MRNTWSDRANKRHAFKDAYCTCFVFFQPGNDIITTRFGGSQTVKSSKM